MNTRASKSKKVSRKWGRRRILTSVQVKPQNQQMLERCVAKGMSKTEVINEALREYFIEKEFQEVRASLVPFAQAQGIYTDEDVERRLQQ